MLPALFEGTSQEEGKYFHVQVDKKSLGVKLINCDDANDSTVQFYPGYAIVGGFTQIPHPKLRKGDIIVAVNGHGFRRFAHSSDTEQPASNDDDDDDTVVLDHAVIPADGTAYQQFMEKLKAVKLAGGDPPLVLTFIRFGWDSRCFAWRRFLSARKGNVPAALELHQKHVQWKMESFPMDIASAGVQAIFSTKAVAQVKSGTIPTVYVNYGSLIQLESAGSITSNDILNAFIMVTELMLAIGDDPRHPKVTQLIDVSGTTYTNFRTDILTALYSVFEPNYPETLHRMILYPISAVAVSPLVGFVFVCLSHAMLKSTTIRAMLSFVNETTRNKFLITGDAHQVCQAMQWDVSEMNAAGGIQGYVHAHEANVMG